MNKQLNKLTEARTKYPKDFQGNPKYINEIMMENLLLW